MRSIKARLSVLLSALVFTLTPLMSEVRAEEGALSGVPVETLYLLHLDGAKLRYTPEKFLVSDLNSMEAGHPLEAMFKTLWADLKTHMKAGTLDQLGLKALKESSYTVYSLGLWPVLDIPIASQKKFARWIAKTAKTSKAKLSKDGKRLFYSTDYNGTPSELSVALYRRDRVRISWYPAEFSKGLSPHLMGKAPATSFSSKFKKLSAEYQLSDGNIFWADIKGAIATLLGRGEGLNAAHGLTRADRLQLPSVCVDEAIELSAHVQYLLSGTKATQGTQATSEDYYAVLKLSPVVAEALTALNGEQLYLPTSKGAVLSLGLGVNVKGILGVANKLLSYLQARSLQCEDLKRMINPQAAQAKLSMLPPFAQQLRGFGVALYSINKPNPSAIILSAERAPALMQVLKSMIPQLRQLQLPAPGAPAEPVQGLPIPPAMGKVFAQLTQDAFGLGVSEQGAKVLKATLAAPPAQGLFLSMQYDLQALLSNFKQYMNRAKQQRRALELQRARSKALAEGREPPTELPESNDDLDDLFESTGVKGFSMESRFTKRGLEFDTTMSYLK